MASLPSALPPRLLGPRGGGAAAPAALRAQTQQPQPTAATERRFHWRRQRGARLGRRAGGSSARSGRQVTLLEPAPARRRWLRVLLASAVAAAVAGGPQLQRLAGVSAWWVGVAPLGAVLGAWLLGAVALAASPGAALRLGHRRARRAPGPGCVAVLVDEVGKEEAVPVLVDPRGRGGACLRWRGETYALEADGEAAEPVRPRLRALAEYSAEGLESAAVAQLQELYGPNSYRVPAPPLRALVLQRLKRPVVLFELVAVALWALDGYWQFMAFSIFSILSFEVFTAFSKFQSLTQLQEMSPKPQPVWVRRNSTWSSISAEELVPGDVVRLETAADAPLPCDMVLLSGGALVDEAALTGESVPQPKEPLPATAEPSRILAPEGSADARSCLFAGTRLVQTGESAPPLGVVLSTGFQTRQGQLMSRLVRAQGEVHDRGTLRAILLLVAFAAAAAGYVLAAGASAVPLKQRLVRAGVVLSFAVTPSLPLLMTYAVQRTTTALTRRGIICTEPFRVPEAGCISTCLFDKTGTLTRPELRLEGVLVPPPDSTSAGAWSLAPAAAAPEHVRQILGGCHSVVPLRPPAAGPAAAGPAAAGPAAPPRGGAPRGPEGTGVASAALAGDPLEVAALRALGWGVVGDASGPQLGEAGMGEVEVLKRFHFSPETKTMSVVALVRNADGQRQAARRLVLAKGAPEAMEKALIEVPPGYRAEHARLAEEGLRVLALGWRALGEEEEAGARAEAERRLAFAGFACFAGELRPEAAEVVAALEDAGVRCAMVTGDAPATAARVAREIGMLRRPSLELKAGSWVGAGRGEDFELGRHEELRGSYDLVCTEAELRQGAWEAAVSARVLARMSPGGKARVVELLREAAPASARGERTTIMMVGDGGNDVGALQEAECGLALLPEKKGPEDQGQDEDPLEWDDAEVSARFREREKERVKKLAAERREAGERVRQRLQDEIATRQRRGQPPMGLGQIFKQLRAWGSEEKAAQAAAAGEAASGCDASAAAAFAVRRPSLRAAPELLRQGQMTIASAVMQTQHLVLSTIVGMARYAALSAEGARMSEIQMMASDTFLTFGFIGFIGARAARRPARTRPPNSLFERAVLVSTLGQAVLSFVVIRAGIVLAKDAMGAAGMRELLAFQRKVDDMPMELGFGEMQRMVTEKLAAGGGFFEVMTALCRPFKPNPLNTVVFLVELSQRATALLINYRGRPWMSGPAENAPLLLGTAGALLLVLLCAVGWQPLQGPLQLDGLAPRLQRQLAVLLALSTLGAAAWDRLSFRLLAPEVCQARAAEPVTLGNPLPMLRKAWPVARKVTLGMSITLLLLSGNLFFWFLAWQLWQMTRPQWQPPPQNAAQAATPAR